MTGKKYEISEKASVNLISELGQFAQYDYELTEILKNNKSIIEEKDFKTKYRLLRNTQLQTILMIIHKIENNFTDVSNIVSKEQEEERLKQLAQSVENFNFLSRDQLKEVYERISILAVDRVYLKDIKSEWIITITINWKWWSKQFLFPVQEVQDYSILIKVSREKFYEVQKYLYGEIDKEIEWICVGWWVPIVFYPDDVKYPYNVFKHEIRHWKDRYLRVRQSSVDKTISSETTAHAHESWSFTKWEMSLTQKWKYDQYVYEEMKDWDKKEVLFGNYCERVEKLYALLRNQKKVNLDLLAITPLAKRRIFLNNEIMDNFTHYASDSIIQRLEPNIWAQERCNQMWINPLSMYWLLKLTNEDMTELWDDIWIFANVKTLFIKSKKIIGDISSQLKSMSFLEKVTLHRNVYDNIDHNFLGDTKLVFEIMDD